MTPDEMADSMELLKYDARNLDQQKQLSAEQMGMPKAEPDRLKADDMPWIYEPDLIDGSRHSNRSGVPLKFRLAARFMAARMANPEYNLSIGGNFIAKEALDFASDLINEFNNQQKEEK